MFAHLGVFAGGATAAAVEVVLGDGPPQAALHALVEASLVQPHGAAGETRFTLLEVVREFAREQLAQTGAPAAAQRAQAEYCAHLAERARPALNGPDQAAWFARLDHELPNMRLALRWAVAEAQALGLRLATALEDYWAVRGHTAEGRRWLGELLAQSGPAPREVQAAALRAAGWLAGRQGDAAAARAAAEQSRDLYLQLEDGGGLSASYNVLGEAALLQSDFTGAQQLFEQSLPLAQEAHDAGAEAGALKGLSEVTMRRGELGRSVGYMEQRLAIYRAREDPRNTTGMLYNLGVIAYEQGDLPTALAHGQASLAAQRALGDQYGLTLGLLHLGNTLSAQGDYAAAQAHLEEALTIHRRQLDREPMAAPLNVLAKVLLSQGDASGAQAHAREGLRLRLEAGDQRGMAVSLRTLAAIAQAGRRTERAAQLLGALDAIRTRIRAPLPANARAEHEQFVAAVRAALGDDAFQAAWDAGHALTLEQAVALGLA